VEWLEFIDKVYLELKEGDHFSDIRVPLKNEQALTRTLALGLGTIFASSYGMSIKDQLLFDCVTYRQGDTKREKEAYSKAKDDRWIFFHMWGQVSG
jgi:hypothetical protein